MHHVLIMLYRSAVLVDCCYKYFNIILKLPKKQTYCVFKASVLFDTIYYYSNH